MSGLRRIRRRARCLRKGHMYYAPQGHAYEICRRCGKRQGLAVRPHLA